MTTATIEKTAAKVVSPAEWLAARKQLLAKEKEFTHLRDELSRQRREMPWEKVEKKYVFEGPKGKETLAGLFDGRSQLIIYHFMFGPAMEGRMSELLVPVGFVRCGNHAHPAAGYDLGGCVAGDLAGD